METTDRIEALLHDAAETHHIVYRIVDGDDPDWATSIGVVTVPGAVGGEGIVAF